MEAISFSLRLLERISRRELAVILVKKMGGGDEYQVAGNFIHPCGKVAEMVPELVVPDLSDCSLKPYVAYSTKELLSLHLTNVKLETLVIFKRE